MNKSTSMVLIAAVAGIMVAATLAVTMTSAAHAFQIANANGGFGGAGGAGGTALGGISGSGSNNDNSASANGGHGGNKNRSSLDHQLFVLATSAIQA